MRYREGSPPPLVTSGSLSSSASGSSPTLSLGLSVPSPACIPQYAQVWVVVVAPGSVSAGLVQPSTLFQVSQIPLPIFWHLPLMGSKEPIYQSRLALSSRVCLSLKLPVCRLSYLKGDGSRSRLGSSHPNAPDWRYAMVSVISCDIVVMLEKDFLYRQF